MKYRICARFLVIPLLITVARASFAANVFVPSFDMTSWFNLKGEVQTRGMFDLSVDGGYKYQAQLSLQYYNLDIESNPAQSLIFNGAQASIRNVFDVLDITYWTGFYGILGEGKHYKGHLYHLENGFDYVGFFPVVGTGVILGGHFERGITSGLYLYQRFGSGSINSLDLTFGLVREPFTFSLFSGVSGSAYRAGTQFTYTGKETELYITSGTLSISKSNRLEFDDFYLLAEEWFKMKNWNLILSVFTRPDVHYNYVQQRYVATGERSDIDFNFDLNYAFEETGVALGGEFNIQTNTFDDLGVYLSPYVTIFTSGLLWKIKVDFNLLSQTRDFVTAYLNLQSSF